MSHSLLLPAGDVCNIANIYAVARNYSDTPQPPLFFQKSLGGFTMASKLHLPAESTIAFELELVAILGHSCYKADEEKGADAIVGYALGIDFTDQPLQKDLASKGHPWDLAKCFRDSCVLTKIMPKDSALATETFWLKQNGKIVQQAKITDLNTSPGGLVSLLSQRLPLLRGDLIYTGTPKGVGPAQHKDVLELGVQDVVLGRYEILRL